MKRRNFGDLDEVKIDDYSGFEISVVKGTGGFVARRDDVQFDSNDLTRLKQRIDRAIKDTAKIDKEPLALNCLGLSGKKGGWDSWSTPKDWKIVNVTVTGLHRRTRAFQFAEKAVDADFVIPDSPKNREALERLIAAEIEVREARRIAEAAKIHPEGYGVIEPENYENIIKTMKAKYDKAK